MTAPTTKADDYSLTAFDHVIVMKDKLLTTLKDNREKHEAIYNAAVEGYWIKCKETLDEKTEDFKEIIADQSADYARAVAAIEERFGVNRDKLAAAIEGKDKKGVAPFSLTFDYRAEGSLPYLGNWPLVYPENHLDDYDRVIGMLEFSVADKVELTSSDFNAYVRNRWEWHRSFVGSNTAYVQATTGFLFADICALSGCGGHGEAMTVLNSSPVYQFAAGIDQ